MYPATTTNKNKKIENEWGEIRLQRQTRHEAQYCTYSIDAATGGSSPKLRDTGNSRNNTAI